VVRELLEKTTRAGGERRGVDGKMIFFFRSPTAWLRGALITVQAGLPTASRQTNSPGCSPRAQWPGHANKRTLNLHCACFFLKRENFCQKKEEGKTQFLSSRIQCLKLQDSILL
jgi:hypothetical protein